MKAVILARMQVCNGYTRTPNFLMNSIHYTKPSITNLEVEYASEATATEWGVRCYDYIVKFEKEFAKYLNVRHAIATASFTGALTLGFAALGIGAGDKCIHGVIKKS